MASRREDGFGLFYRLGKERSEFWEGFVLVFLEVGFYFWFVKCLFWVFEGFLIWEYIKKL